MENHRLEGAFGGVERGCWSVFCSVALFGVAIL